MSRTLNLVLPGRSIKEAIALIDRTGLAMVMVVDVDGRLVGTVTDGDVRRAVLRGIDLDSPVTSIMSDSPTVVHRGTDIQEIRRLLLDRKLTHIPVVDAARRVLDLITTADLLSVPLAAPHITEVEIRAAQDVLRGGDLSLGPKVAEFEAKIALCAGRRFAIVVNSGTSALHLIVRGLGIGDGDEVITTPFSFIASSNCILFERATPVFVDINPDTYNIDPDLVEEAITPRTKAILAVDVFGQPAEYDRLSEIARKHNLHLICDSCESIGAQYRGRTASTFGIAGAFGFYPNKQITTGEGGAVVTDDEELAKLCRSMRNQGRGEGGGWLVHERLGFNYRLPDINCAIGSAQIDRIDEILDSRQRVAETYQELLAGLEGIHLPVIHPAVTRMSWFVYVVRLADRYSREDRDELVYSLRQRRIGANAYFQPIHLQKFYVDQFGYDVGSFPVTEHVSERTVAIPFFTSLTREAAESVVECLRNGLEQSIP